MSVYLEDILQKLGWQDGFQIPVANEENKALEEEVARLTFAKIKQRERLNNSNQKIENLENHLKYVEQESEQTQKLITAHSQQVQNEEHNLILLKAEKAKLSQDSRHLTKEYSELKKRRTHKKLDLEKCLIKMDQIKVETNWDNEAIKAWEESLQKHTLDNEYIEKFSKEDQRKYNELEVKRQNLEMEVVARRKTVENMVHDMNNYERIMERTGQVLREQMIERDALIDQWKDSVKILHQRDEDIDLRQKQLFQTHDLIERKNELLQEQNQFLENEKRNNSEIEFEISELNHVISRMRRDLNDVIQTVFLFQNEISTVKRELTATANQLEKERQKRKFLTKEIEIKMEKIGSFEENLKNLRKKCNEITKSCLTAADRTKHLETLISFEQKRHKTLANDINSIQTSILKSQSELDKEIDLTKTQEAQISSFTTGINQLKRYNKDKKFKVDKQHEMVYDLKFKIDNLNGRILKLEFPFMEEIDDSADIGLAEKIQQLEKDLTELTEIKNILQDQIKKMMDDMRRIQTAIYEDQEEEIRLKTSKQNQTLNYEGGLKQIKLLKLQVQERQVEENLLRLRVDHLEKATKKEDKTIYNLQKFRLGLEHALMERIVEINANKEILLVKKRNLGEDRGRLKADLSIRQIRIVQFRKKYEMVVDSLGKDEDGEPLSVTHLKVLNAQEKFLLQQEGDELDCKIRRAEKEIVAMENTLKVVNSTNSNFKHSLKAIEESDLEMDEKERLEKEYLEINDVLRQCRIDLKTEINNVKELTDTYEELINNKKKENEALMVVEDEFVAIQKERGIKEEKLTRSENYLKKLQKKVDPKIAEKYDRNLEISQLKQANNVVMQRLVNMCIWYPEVTPLINRYASIYDIKLPEQHFLSSSTSRSSVSLKSSTSNKSDKRTLKRNL